MAAIYIGTKKKTSTSSNSSSGSSTKKASSSSTYSDPLADSSNGTWSIDKDYSGSGSNSSSNISSAKSSNTNTSNTNNAASVSSTSDWLNTNVNTDANGYLPAYSDSGGAVSSSYSNTGNASSAGTSGSAANTASSVQMSDENKTKIANLQALWSYYTSIGDTASANKAHDDAEAIRSNYSYSGGADGSGYTSLYDPYNVSGLKDTSVSSSVANNTASNTANNSTGNTTSNTTYDDYYNNNGYSQLSATQKAAIDAYVSKAVNNINTQKTTVNQDADELARQAYISYMQSKTSLPQQLAASGYSGGLADSQLLSLDTNLQNNQNKIEQNRTNTLTSLDSDSTDAQLQGSIEAADQQAAVAQAAISAFNTYKSQAAQTANSNYWNQKNYDYQTSQDAATASQKAQSTAYNSAMALMQMGVIPNDSMLTAAGISYSEAEAYVASVKETTAAALSAKTSKSTSSSADSSSSTSTYDTALTFAENAFESGNTSDDVIKTLLAGGYTMNQLTASGYTPSSGSIYSDDTSSIADTSGSNIVYSGQQSDAYYDVSKVVRNMYDRGKSDDDIANYLSDRFENGSITADEAKEIANNYGIPLSTGGE